MPDLPVRAPWEPDFPPVWIHAAESAAKQHPAYAAAKAGDPAAALALLNKTINVALLRDMGRCAMAGPVHLVPVRAEEAGKINVIPEVLAATIADLLSWRCDMGIVQSNVVRHTGSGGL